ncbi:hypothetical protein PROFUN_00628 [Planoprotostelium fungivorum]|uniref:PUM-HD domain-containing protein n=1 Tax=Planoprotostelium fungivorum TaxID=1890364 RepID=A0A2P6MUB0_9EUKA|nr:hypothetical protein PROFUN_15825 [Planoprotostelium fungivorum]PRP87417.1 hypothetical protein PROFUN_00628 [Planoprotostelium fungivorum]
MAGPPKRGGGAKPSPSKSFKPKPKSDASPKKKFDNKPNRDQGKKPQAVKREGSKDNKKPFTDNKKFADKKFTDNKKSFTDNKKSFTDNKKSFTDKKRPREEEDEAKQQFQPRKVSKPNYEMVTQSKFLWEKVRAQSMDEKERQTHLIELIELIRGKIPEIVEKHDASRVVQTCIKYGTESQREEIFLELKPRLVEFCKSQFGHFLVAKLLKYIPKQRSTIINMFKGSFKILLKHKAAYGVVESMYCQYATNKQKKEMMYEFFGSQVAIQNTGATPKTLTQILGEVNDAQKTIVLNNLRDNLKKITEKGAPLVRNTMVHALLLEYFKNDLFSGQEEMLSNMKETLIEYVHTKEGAKVGVHCVSIANAKDRKVIIKGMKGYMIQAAKEQYGHVVLLRILDVVDDSILVEKSILFELTKDLRDLSFHPYGRMALLFILSPRKPAYFSPATLELLQPPTVPQVDETGQVTMITNYKKTPETRRDALLSKLSPHLLRFCTDNVRDMLYDEFARSVLLETLVNAEGDKEGLIKVLVQRAITLVGREKNEDDEKKEEGLSPSVVNVLKSCIKNNNDFASTLADSIEEVEDWIGEDSVAILILCLLDNPSSQAKIQKKLKPHAKKLNKSEGKIIALISEKMK